MGSPLSSGAAEESPSFVTRVAPFCLDRTEVTLRAYRACQASGACSAASRAGRFCNERLGGREEHPVNCVTWHQAAAYCEHVGRRLPAETEWEFAGRGGERGLEYPWGNEPPDGRTCWKHVGGTCAVGEYPAGAFDLLDLGGNVWEWTADWFGAYPWEPTDGHARSYRGGSWSRRFEKWMRPRLRNRSAPDDFGSHLGFRCALTLPGVECPYGPRDGGRGCARGVETADCPAGQRWNGARCARPGEPRCAAGRIERPGRGCVLERVADGPAPGAAGEPIAWVRAPAHDADCAAHQPGRPHGYHATGGTHQARNAAGAARGCKNRDVGVGWNSTCCP
ncbi:MAG: SUMF1/EgtB/PvdO family nonheme iron enzyme [Polyangiaceae bacterium]|nr:SUMF1/EgtB/PvdO family nonheme iron enzyme [Polyangiaceae bacterium]